MTTMQQTTTTTPTVTAVDPATVRSWAASGQARLVDVREGFEHATEHIADDELRALSAFDPESLAPDPSAKVVFYCRTGRRSLDAAEHWTRVHGVPGWHLEGGIEAWKQAGLATTKPAGGPPIDVMRQMQITAGTLVLLGTVLGLFVSEWFLALSGGIGAGLIFAGASGWCGMAMLLARLPWNRTRTA